MYFDKSCFHFHLPWGILWFHLWFHFWPVVFLVAWCLFSVFVLFLFFLPVVDFWFHTTVVGKNVLNCFLINYFGFIVVSGFFLLLSNKINSLLFSLSLTLTVSMKIGKRFPVTVKGVSLCGSIPVQPACAWWLWWESWIRCEHKSCLSLWCAVSSHLGGTWSWSGRSQKQVWTQDCPLPRGRTARSGPVWSRIVRLLWAGSALLGCVSSLLQPWHPCTGWSCSTGASGSSWYRLGCGLWPSGLAPRPDCFGCSASVSANNGCSCPQTPVWVWATSVSQRSLWCLSLALAVQTPVWRYTLKPAGLEHLLGSGWGMYRDNREKPASHRPIIRWECSFLA